MKEDFQADKIKCSKFGNYLAVGSGMSACAVVMAGKSVSMMRDRGIKRVEYERS